MRRPGIGLAALAAAAAASAGTVLAVTPESEEPASAPRSVAVSPAARAAADLTPRQLAGQRIVCGFDGRGAPASLRRVISNGELAGVILFDDNIRSRGQVSRLTAAIQVTERPAGLGQPVLISVDQEGGQVKRLPGPPRLSAERMGRRGEAVSRAQGVATGESLREVGINVDLAPVLDVARPGGFIAEQDRGFGAKPGRVARVGVAFASGLESAGVAATAKHFPGLGSTAANTDLRPARIRLPARKLRRVDEAPYESYVAAGGRLVMVSSARYPSLGGRLPGSQSRAIATTELRERLGFTGVSISDSLEAPGARAGSSAAKVAVRAAGAGTDLLLYVHCDAGVRAAKALRRALAAGRLDRAQFEASVDRVLGLRASLSGPRSGLRSASPRRSP
jgi:beta-N-acetylhexosaminidase